MNTAARQSMWLAQCGFESSSFNVLRENLAYKPEQLVKTFPSHFHDIQTATKFALRPQDLGNFIYAERNGNGDFASGDGFKYRGGGLIELTGRANYATIGKHLGLDLENRPLLIEQPAIAARTAGLFWQLHGLNEIADAGDVVHATKVINGGTNGLAGRTDFWKALCRLNSAS